jgi:hypothetical protein
MFVAIPPSPKHSSVNKVGTHLTQAFKCEQSRHTLKTYHHIAKQRMKIQLWLSIVIILYVEIERKGEDKIFSLVAINTMCASFQQFPNQHNHSNAWKDC